MLVKTHLCTNQAEFGIWSPSNRVSIINYIWVRQCAWVVLATPTGGCFGCKKKELKDQPGPNSCRFYYISC